MIAYKLVRKAKDGQLYPLFIDKARPYIVGEPREAEFHPTKGFAERFGFHVTFIPWAPHLKMELASGQKRVWIECWVDGVTTYARPESQGGTWGLAEKLTVIRELTQEEVEVILKSSVQKKGA